jgi:hypothetical protein
VGFPHLAILPRGPRPRPRLRSGDPVARADGGVIEVTKRVSKFFTKNRISAIVFSTLGI